MFYYPLPEFTNANWKEYTLLMPVVAAGNVGQLTIDLLLSSLVDTIKLIGRIHHPVILPLAGADPYNIDSKALATACQVYACDEFKLVILQQRTPVSATGRSQFCSLMTNWIKNESFAKTILISSCFSHFLTDSELKKKLQYLQSPDIKSDISNKLKDIEGLHLLQPRNSFTLEEDSEGTINLPGSGITKQLYFDLLETKLPVLVFLMFCSEGDNIPDAFNMAETLKKIVNLQNDKSSFSWKIPVSWNAMFGNSAPKTIY